MRTRLLGFLFLAFLLVAVPAQAEEPVTIDSCANPLTNYASNLHPIACAGTCTGLTSEQLIADPSICPKCGTVAAQLLLYVPPVGIALSSGVTAWAGTNCIGTALGSARDATYYAICAKGPSGPNCCISMVEPGENGPNGTPVGRITKETCRRNDQSALANEKEYEVFYADCYCRVKKIDLPPKPGQTYDQCLEYCKTQEGEIVPSLGIGVFASKAGVGPSTANSQFVNALCFTREQCSSPEYGGAADAFVPSSECQGNKGKCLAPEPELTLSSPVLGVQTIRGLRRYIDLMVRYMLSIVVIAATIMFVWAGFKYILASSMGSVKSSKETMVNAVIGLLLSFGGFTLLNTVNPATTRLDRLSVYLINKQEFVELEYCRDYKAAPGKQLSFADAGTPAGSVVYDQAKFEVEQSATLCGKDYYPESLAGKTCHGLWCGGRKGEACLACSSGLSECGGNDTGFACVKASIAGNIKFQDGREPLEVQALAVCEDFDPNKTIEEIEDSIPETINMKLIVRGQSAVFRSDETDFADLQSACNGKKGLRGIIFGVRYTDTSLGGAAQTAANSGHALGDFLIVTRKNCGTSGLYAAYVDGNISDLSLTTTRMKAAISCGSQVTPNQKGGTRSPKDTFVDPGLYWSAEDIQKAFSGEADPIQCNFFLNDANAPSDPGTTLMAGCG